MKILSLIIEKGDEAELWGRIDFRNELIVDSASNIDELENRMKVILKDFHNIAPDSVKFNLEFDLTALFLHKDFLNISGIAKKAGINPSLMRQYASGKKYPSEKRAKKIESVINELGNELKSIRITTTRIDPADKNNSRKVVLT